MAHHFEVEGLRERATVYLQSLLNDVAGKSPRHMANSIIEHALQDSNPLKELLSKAGTVDASYHSSPKRMSTVSTSHTLKSKSSLGFLKLGRRDNKNEFPQSKASVAPSQSGDSQTLPPGTSALYAEIFGDWPNSVKSTSSQTKAERSPKSSYVGRSGTVKRSVKGVPMSSFFPLEEKALKASGSVPYCCIICTDSLSSKGVCKRHLEEQHVSPKVYDCEKCGARFTIKSEAKKHSDVCGAGQQSYTIRRQDDKKVYACEFTGKCFLSRSKYIDHLLELCQGSCTRPEPDSHRKLCGLLDQPSLRPHLAEISIRVYGSRRAWKTLQWSDTHISKAIEQLEYATVQENGTIEFGKNAGGIPMVQNARVYLNSLLCAGSLPRRNSSQTVVRDKEQGSRSRSQTQPQPHMSGSDSGSATPTATTNDISEALRHQLNVTQVSSIAGSPMVSDAIDASHSMTAELKSKRHLSDNSRFYVPNRCPPGPPTMPRFPQNANSSAQNLQPSCITNTSCAPLPFRTQERSLPVHPLLPTAYGHASYDTGSGFSSDAISESTLATSYQEPELLGSSSFGCNVWTNQQNAQNYPFMFDAGNSYGLSEPLCFLPDDASMRSSSTATGQTWVADYPEQDQKVMNFGAFPSYDLGQQRSFFLDDDDQYDTYGQS